MRGTAQVVLVPPWGQNEAGSRNAKPTGDKLTGAPPEEIFIAEGMLIRKNKQTRRSKSFVALSDSVSFYHPLLTEALKVI